MAANRTGPQEQVAPPGPARTGPIFDRATRTEFVVLTRSDELLEQVGVALDGAGEVRHAENEEDARQFADPRHATVMLLDAREPVDPGLAVERLHASDGSTVIVVFAPSDVVADLARAIKGSAAFAVLPIPLEVDQARAVLLGAGEEALARRALVVPAPAGAPVQIEPDLVSPQARDTLPEYTVAAGGGTPRASRSSSIALLAVACLLIAATGAWFYLRDGAEPSIQVTAGASGQQTSTADEPGGPWAGGTAGRLEPQLSMAPKDELLDQARVAFHERRYTEPVRDNALYYYRSVLAQDPGDAEAREGLERIGAVLEGRLETALAERRSVDAALAFEQLRSIRPEDTALVSAAAQLAELDASRSAAQERGEEAVRRPAEARALGRVPERRPAGTSAAAGATAIAQRGTAAPAAEIPAAVREDVPEEPAAPAAAPAQPGLTAADFRRTRYVAPVYPAHALARGQSGEVRVRITVDTDGRVTAVNVLSASPPGVFDQAAVSAVRKWRFEPVMKEGRAIEASVATTIRFQPDDGARR